MARSTSAGTRWNRRAACGVSTSRPKATYKATLIAFPRSFDDRAGRLATRASQSRQFGLRVATGRRGVAFHVGSGVHITAAHCVNAFTEGAVVYTFGTDAQLTRLLAGDAAVMMTRESPDRVFTLSTTDDPAPV